MQGIYVFGTILGASEEPYKFKNKDTGEEVTGMTRIIGIHAGDQVDMFDNPQPVIVHVKCPAKFEEKWIELKTLASQLKGKQVHMNVDSGTPKAGGISVCTVREDTVITESKLSTKAA